MNQTNQASLTHQLAALELLRTPVWVIDIQRSQVCWANRSALRLWNAKSQQELIDRSSDLAASIAIQFQGDWQQLQQEESITKHLTFYSQGEKLSARCVCSALYIDDRPVVLIEAAVEANETIGSDLLPVIEQAVSDHSQTEATLQTLNEELENRVAARTAELSRANARLQAEIAKRQRVELVLRESEARFYKLVFNIPGMIYQYIQRVDGTGQFSYISPSCQEIYEVAPGDAQADAELLFQMVHPDDYQAVRDSLAGSAESLEPWQALYRIITPSQKLKWIQAISRPDVQPDGEIVWDGVLMDVSDRKNAEEALQESEELFRRVFDDAPIGMSLADADRRIIKVNQTFCQMLGYTEDELLMLTIPEITHPDDIQSNLKQFEQALNGTISHYRIEKRFFKKNGDVLWGNLTATFLHDPEGNPLFSLGMLEDITDRKQAEIDMQEALERERELSELKSSFISTVSHEFRTPLSIITTSVELLQHYSQAWTEEKKQLRFNRIYSAIEWMTKLLNDVLMIGRIEAGKLHFNPTPMDVGRFCRNLVEELQSSLSLQQTLTLIQQGNCDDISLDESLLNHILTNLVGNAIKYSPGISDIHLELDCRQDKVQFCIRDTGIGISDEDQAQLFTAFQRGSNVGTISGTGLGLAIVKQCVDLHGGSIAVSSEIGKGTMFIVTLPLQQQPWSLA